MQKKTKTSKNDFHVKSIVKEGERSCYHKTYFSTRELSCVFILFALKILKFEEVGVHCNDEIETSLSYLLAPKIEYILVVQLFAER